VLDKKKKAQQAREDQCSLISKTLLKFCNDLTIPKENYVSAIMCGDFNVVAG
jgi:endonuclease/exonuclease/phosphatase family metal-dependent hydrolase